MKNVIEEIQNIFIDRNWTLSAAESCTGGALSASLTEIPGCSKYFLGSVIAYSNELKIKLLGVEEAVLEQAGAVSQEVVEQMAQGVIKLTHSDYALAVSGIAGPTGETPLKPLGTVWAAIASKKGSIYSWTFHIDGSRADVIQGSVEQLLHKLLLVIKTL